MSLRKTDIFEFSIKWQIGIPKIGSFDDKIDCLFIANKKLYFGIYTIIDNEGHFISSDRGFKATAFDECMMYWMPLDAINAKLRMVL